MVAFDGIRASVFLLDLDGCVVNAELTLSADAVDVPHSSVAEVGADMACHNVFSACE